MSNIQNNVYRSRRFEQALHESEEIYRKLVELSPNAIAAHDISGRIIFVNPSGAKMVGAKSAQELMGRNIMDFVHPDYRQRVTDEISKMFEENRGVQPLEQRLIKMDGTPFYVEVSGVPLTYQGKPAVLLIAMDISERIHNRELKERERQRLYRLLDELPAFVYLQSNDHTITFANRYFWKLFGVPQRGQKCYEIIHKRNKPCEKCSKSNFFETLDNQRWDWIDDKTGKAYRVYSYPFCDVDDVLMKLVLGYEITDQIKLQGALESREKELEKQLQYATALNKIAETIIYSNDTIHILDAMAGIIGETLGVDRSSIYDIDFKKHQVKGLSEWLNPGTPGLTATKDAYSLDLFIDASTYMLTNKKWLENNFDEYSPRAMGAGPGALLHGHLKIKSELWYPFAFRDNSFYCLVFNQVSHKRYWQGNEIDFINAAAKHVEIALQKLNLQQENGKRQEAFSLAFDLSPALMCITTFPEGKFIDANENFLRVTGFSREEVIGHTVHELEAYKHVEQHAQLLTELLTNETVSSIKIKFHARNGEERYGLYSADIIEINNTKCCLSVIKDITDLTNYENEMTRLERLNLVGQMAASIGHEIRNPMTTVRGFLQMFGSKPEFAEHKRYFDIMIDELDRANSIISEFLSLAKNKPANTQMKNINDIVMTLYPLINADALKNDIYTDLKLQTVSDLPLDEKEIRQLILNLCRNGLESMDGGKTLTILTYDSNNETVLAVKDQGQGINKEILDKMGTPFLTTKEQGTGLGLAVCFSIAARHNARIDIKTGPEGTIFYIRFKHGI